VTSFVPRLASLVRISLGPAQYHCLIVIQLVLTNVVLAIPLFLLQPPPATHIYPPRDWVVLAAGIVTFGHCYCSCRGQDFAAAW
jgi:hypothetical protein